jgi:putative ABC transport system permease protein
MSVTLQERPAAPAAAAGDRSNGGAPARRAVVRWAWRLFRREWRQQLLILALITVAVAALIVAGGVAADTPQPANFGFGTADYLATFHSSGAHLDAQIAQLQHRVGRVDVIENQTLPVPGSVTTYQLRAQNPHGPFGQPMLSLVSGHYPTGPNEVAMTQGVASDFNLRLGDVWHQGGTDRRLVGIVQNPQSLLDEFALVAPGQVHNPTQVTALFDTSYAKLASLGPNISAPLPPNGFNPTTFLVMVATLGMLLIGLVAVGGFTVLAQRRLRSIGMLGALGATDRNIGGVVRANGVVVGVVGTALGFALGMAVWLGYRPHLQQNAHHLIGTWQLPWLVVILSMVLAVVATYLAAARPARTITRIPIVTALSGRPAPPPQTHRSTIPGVLALVIAFLGVTAAGASGGNGGGMLFLVVGFVALIVAIILLAPLTITALARLASRAPVSGRLALRDMARYRARSGSALAAISLAVTVAVIICVIANARYSNVLDYVGPNLSSNQLIVYTPAQGGPGTMVVNPGLPPEQAPLNTTSPQALAAATQGIAASLGSHDVIPLMQASANLHHAGAGRDFNGQLYVATPQLLRAFGITSADYSPNADILSVRPGFAGISNMQLIYSGPDKFGPGGQDGNNSCQPGSCVANPKTQEVSQLPSGTSAPNTVITEHAVHQLHLQTSLAGWMIVTPHALNGSQIQSSRRAAAATGMTVETKSDSPTSGQILDTATIFGLLLALGILAMTVGLIRSETASDLRTLIATGASSKTRRNITAATAAALGLLGAFVGTAAGYLVSIAFFRSSPNGDGLSELSSIPLSSLLILWIGLPLFAAVGGWVFAGRQPQGVAQRPME